MQDNNFCAIPEADRYDDIDRRMAKTEQDVAALKRAFLLNDLGEPGYDDHRTYHRHRRESDDIVESYKQDATKKVLGAVGVLLLTLVGAGVVTTIVGQIK